MITYVQGNLFESPAQVLVNTVNTVGVMGKGIALQFKKIYPDMFKEYRDLCERKQFKIGSLHLYKTPHKWILNFATKREWRRPSQLQYIPRGSPPGDTQRHFSGPNLGLLGLSAPGTVPSNPSELCQSTRPSQ